MIGPHGSGGSHASTIINAIGVLITAATTPLPTSSMARGRCQHPRGRRAPRRGPWAAALPPRIRGYVPWGIPPDKSKSLRLQRFHRDSALTWSRPPRGRRSSGIRCKTCGPPRRVTRLSLPDRSAAGMLHLAFRGRRRGRRQPRSHGVTLDPRPADHNAQLLSPGDGDCAGRGPTDLRLPRRCAAR